MRPSHCVKHFVAMRLDRHAAI